MLIKKIVATHDSSGPLKKAAQFIGFSIWLMFQRASQQMRIKKALKLIKKINQPSFKERPDRLFSYVCKLDPFVFEELLLLSFKYRGIKVIHNKRYTHDLGIDGKVILEGRRYALQAKRYTKHINPEHINRFKQDIISNRCDGGFFIHCGTSGKGVYQNLDSSIHLISGTALHQLLTTVFD